MKIGIFLTNHTKELFFYLENQFRKQVELMVCCSEEEFLGTTADLFLLEPHMTHCHEILLNRPQPPLIVILSEGSSHGNIRYLPDFKAQFPALLESLQAQEPMLCLMAKHQKYTYHQKDIILLKEDDCLTLFLRSGRTTISTESFSSVFKRLSPRYFFRVNRQLAVNVEYLTKFDGNQILLHNGWTIPIPPEDKRKVENAFFKTKYYRTQHFSSLPH